MKRCSQQGRVASRSRGQKIIYQLTHPLGQCVQPDLKVIADYGAVDRIIEDAFQSSQKRVLARRQHVAEPVHGLHESHGGPARPVQTTWSRKLKVDRHVTEPDWPDTGIGMDGHAGRDCVRQSELVGSRNTVHEQSSFVSAGHRIDNSSVIGIGRFSG